jgi:nitrogen PTS system EIIA component
MNPVFALNRLSRPGIVGDGPSGPLAPREISSESILPEPRNQPPRSSGGNAEPPLSGGSARRVAQWLRPQEIVLDVDVQDRDRALATAAAYIGRAHGLDPAPIFRALLRREQVGSTALGQGVAIPHARIAGIARPLTLFMRTRLAIAFGAPDGKLVSNLLVIMVPADGAADDHLQLLAAFAEAFSDRAFRASLAASTTALEVDRAFAEWAGQRQA